MSRETSITEEGEFPPTAGPAEPEAAGRASAGRRVLVLSPQPFYQDRGTPIAVRRLSEALCQMGYQVDLLTYPVGEAVEIPGLRIIRADSPLPISEVPIGLSLRKLVLDVALLRAFLAQLRREKYHCIHALEEAALPAVVAGRRAGVPVIYDMQSSLPEQLTKHRLLRSGIVQKGMRSVERWLLHRADVIVCSAGLGRYVRSVRPQGEVEEWCFPSEWSDPEPGEVEKVRRSLAIGPAARVILYSGNFAHYQGVEQLLKAAERVTAAVPETIFVLVGADGPIAAPLAARIERLGQSVRVVPRVPRDSVSAYLAAADILVSPRLYGNNLPLKVFDYLAAGKPIVATDLPCHRTVLNDEVAVLVKSGASGLSHAMVELLQDPQRAAAMGQAGRAYAGCHLHWASFLQRVGDIYRKAVRVPAEPGAAVGQPFFPRVSVVIPARDEAPMIGRVVEAVRSQCPSGMALEVIVVDDGSIDGTAEASRRAGAIVTSPPKSGNPAAARNHGARIATGDPVIFLDADCIPAPGWLAAMLSAHAAGEVVVGGSLALPGGLSVTARCDYYCGWYLTHPLRRAGHVPHHPPPNLSVRRSEFLGTCGFSEEAPLNYTNEERAWQAELRRAGRRIFFEPKAAVYHHNRPGMRNLMRRNYRWAYTAIESKSQTRSARMAWLYRHPRLLIAGALPLAFVHAGYIIGCWARARVYEPVAMLPLILASRFAYASGMAVGGIRWLRRVRGGVGAAEPRGWSK